MKIAVEIPDVIYKKLINGEIHFGGITSKNIFNYVKNGTPIKLSEKAEENEDEISRNAMLEIEKASKSNWNSVLFKTVNELPLATHQIIKKILKNIRLDIALKSIPSDSDEYDYEAKWMNRGLRMALEVIDKYKTDIDELDRGNGMTREEAIKIFKDKIKTMEHGAVCCNYGIDKDAFLLAIQALEQEPCKDAISRKAVLEIVRDMHDLARADVLSYTINQIEKLSPINQEPKEGYWIKEKSLHGCDGKSYQCSVCGRSIHIDTEVEDLTDYPYCHCGAMMHQQL